MDLRKFYKQINRRLIKDFINDNQEEHLTLDFKTVNKADFSNRDDRRNFAKSLSGFANSSGGIIIWGVEAKPNQQGIDCACGKKEIQPLSQLISKLNEFTGQFVHPTVNDVVHRKIVTSGDKGFAVTLVSESDSGPHMAKGGEDRYYKRSGDSFYRMEHFDIEDMFGRRKKPKLSLCTEIKRKGFSGHKGARKFDCHLFVGIENSGRGIAKHVAIEIELNDPYHLGDIRYHTNEEYGFQLLKRPRSEVRLISLGADAVIHPKSSLIVALIPFKVMETLAPPQDVVIEAEIMAEDMRIVKDRKVVKGNKIKEKIIPKDE